MEILQLTFTLKPGGAEKFVVNLSNQLAEMGHDVTLVQLRSDDGEEDIYFNRQFLSSKVKYQNLGFTKGFTYKKAIKVMNALRRIKPDVVHTHLNVLPYVYPLTLLPFGPRFVHTLHSVADKETRILWQQKVNRLVYKLGLVTPVTISNECKQSFEKLYGIKSPICIDNGCPRILSTTDFDKVKTEIQNFKHTKSTKIFVHVARYNEAKNQRLLIEAFNQIIKAGTDAELLIIGGGFETDDGLKLQELACDRVHFLGVRPNIGDYLMNSDYFILSSLWEGLPISLIEAMSAKVIPISTPAGGVTNVIKNGVNGFLAQDFTIENLIATINRALSSQIDRQQIYDAYVMSYSMEQCATSYEQVYRHD